MTTRIPIRMLPMIRLLVILVLAGPGCFLGGETSPAASLPYEKTVTVMTQNLYLGAEVAPVIHAAMTDPSSTPGAVTAVWAKVRATGFPERARALALQIDRMRPDLIGLQEAVIYRSQFPADSLGPSPTPATHVEYDAVALLQDALSDLGLRYAVVAVSDGFDVELPRVRSIDPLELEDVRLTEREVILASSERHPALEVSHAEAGHFETNRDLGFVVVRRGWASVDAKIHGERFRFVTTHLEADSERVRMRQAYELRLGPANTRLPLVLLGDFNSSALLAETPAAHSNLLSAGLRDAWSLTGRSEPGHTCCHDELLVAPIPFAASRERIDLILLSPAFEVLSVDVVGDEPSDRTPTGLWPSDHAGVVAKLRLR